MKEAMQWEGDRDEKGLLSMLPLLLFQSVSRALLVDISRFKLCRTRRTGGREQR